MTSVLLVDVFFVMMVLAGVWDVATSIRATKPLAARENLSLAMFADWYGYFFGVLLIIIAVAGLCGAFS